MLRVGAWGGEIQDALRERVWGPFARLTGCVIQEVTADYGQLTASQEGEGAPYLDVLLADAFWAQGALARSAVEPIPADRIDRSRFALVLPNDGAIPAYSYAMVSSFRRDAVTQTGAPDSWATWWDAAELPGARSLPRSPLGTLEFALLADGVPREELYPLDVQRAIAHLQTISAEIGDRWWESGEQPVLWMSNKRAQFAASWHYRIIAGQQDGRPLDYVWDDALLVSDHWLITRGTPALEVALDFLAFASAPEVQASLAGAVPLGPVVDQAFDFIDGRTADRLPTAPETREKLIQVDATWWSNNRDDARQEFDSWLLGLPMNES